jgi:hypothetical protein
VTALGHLGRQERHEDDREHDQDDGQPDGQGVSKEGTTEPKEEQRECQRNDDDLAHFNEQKKNSSFIRCVWGERLLSAYSMSL